MIFQCFWGDFRGIIGIETELITAAEQEPSKPIDDNQKIVACWNKGNSNHAVYVTSFEKDSQGSWHILQQQPPIWLDMTSHLLVKWLVGSGHDRSHTSKMTSWGAVGDQSGGGLWLVTY